MKPVAVYLIGRNVFAESLLHILGNSDEIAVLGMAQTLTQACQDERIVNAGVVIIAETQPGGNQELLSFLESLGDIPVIYTHLEHGNMQVITSVSYKARIHNLKEAILSLSKRRQPYDANESP